ncbi:MAG: pentapeptide repeat-containing protein [Aulosira sp. ZfuVER01]
MRGSNANLQGANLSPQSLQEAHVQGATLSNGKIDKR